MSTYLWIDLGAFLIPFLFSFHPRLRFDRTWHALWPAIGCMMLLFILGRMVHAPRHLDFFRGLAGLELFRLPLEEWLFFICIPYACLFTYYCFRVLGVKDYLGKNTAIFTWALIAGLLLVNIFFPGKAYTSSAFGGLALWLLLLQLWMKPQSAQPCFRLSHPVAAFQSSMGSSRAIFLEEAVVWYKRQNLAVRIGTIPVEDIFYGLFMFLMTVTVYEALLKRRKVIGDRTVSAKPVKL
jgi:hypothetical protein